MRRVRTANLPTLRVPPRVVQHVYRVKPGSLAKSRSHSDPRLGFDSRQCATGHWCTASEQVPCGENKWNSQSRSHDVQACELCPIFSSTFGLENASSRAQCVCDINYFDNSTLSGREQPDCRPCGVGTSCKEQGTTLTTLPLDRGCIITGLEPWLSRSRAFECLRWQIGGPTPLRLTCADAPMPPRAAPPAAVRELQRALTS